MRRRSKFALFGLALLAALAPALAGQRLTALESSGRALARQDCARCHAVGRHGASPNRRAPPFRELGRRYQLEGLEEALAEGIAVGHQGPEMPHFRFSPHEIDALIAYMRALQPK